MSGALYLELLSDTDLGFLARAAPTAATEAESVLTLKRSPGLLEDVLGRPEVHEHLLRRSTDPLLVISPFLAFALIVNRAAADLSGSAFVREWIAPGQRVPVFDSAGLRDFASPSGRRVFLAELLASYIHTESGRVWTRTARGYHRRRYSELDPLTLAGLLEVVPRRDRGAIYRRLGDLALFLSGVFPDHSGRREISPRDLGRIRRLLEADGEAYEELSAMETLEWLGRSSYRLADLASGGPGPLSEIAAHFGDARRLLNFVTDRYVFPLREGWFGAA